MHCNKNEVSGMDESLTCKAAARNSRWLLDCHRWFDDQASSDVEAHVLLHLVDLCLQPQAPYRWRYLIHG